MRRAQALTRPSPSGCPRRSPPRSTARASLDESHPLVARRAARHHVPWSAAADAADVLLVVGAELGNSDMWQGMLRHRRSRGPHRRRPGDGGRQPAAPTPCSSVTPRWCWGSCRALRSPPCVDAGRRTSRVGDRAAPRGVRGGTPAAGATMAAVGRGDRRRTAPRRGGRHRQRDVRVLRDDRQPADAIAPSSFHFPTGFGTLGFTVPVAIGAALAAPDRQVVGISGDGGLLFTATELAVAAAEQLPDRDRRLRQQRLRRDPRRDARA